MSHLSVLLAAALQLVAWAQSGAQAAPHDGPDGPIRLRMVVPTDPVAPFDRELEDIVRDFNSSQRASRVELVKSGSSFESLRALIAAHYAADLPELALVSAADVETLDALGVVEALPPAWVAAKKINPLFPTGHCHGTTPCSLPYQRTTPVWYFNRELLFKLGQSTDRIPTSWDKLAAFAHAYTKSSELWGVAVPEVGYGAVERWPAMGLSAQLGTEAFVTWVRQMWEHPGSWLPGSPSADEATKLFLEQRAVVLLGTLDQSAFLKNNATFRIGAALPTSTDLTWSGRDVVVLTTGPTAERARDFLDYLYRSENLLKVAEAAATLPTTRGLSALAGWTRLESAQPILHAAAAHKFKRLLLERLSPQIRDDVTQAVWAAVEAQPAPADRPAKAAELKELLQKKLSAISH